MGLECLYPFMSAMISPEGMVRLCSSSIEKIGDLREHSLSSVFLEGGVRTIRETMARGDWPAACRGCQKAETLGLPSKRQKFYVSQEKIYGRQDCEDILKATKPRLQHLDLSFSNLCNLACVTCSGSYSTGWFRHQNRARADGLHYQESEQNLTVRKLPAERVDEIIHDHLPSLRSIVIKGGEPLADPECFRFLSRIAESKDRRDDLSLFVQTNGTVIKPEMMDLLGALRASVGFSIDGIDKVFQWIRGADFKSVKCNLDKLGRTPGIEKIFLDCTVSAFNVLHLSDFAEFALGLRTSSPFRLKCTFMGWANQDYLSPRLLSQELRDRAFADLLKVVNRDPDFFEGLHSLEKILKAPRLSSGALEKFMKWKDFCNRMRGFQIESLYPELHDPR